MDWYEKEAWYEERYRRGRRIDPYKYIPQRLCLAGAIDQAFADSDGIWLYLADGWTAYDGGEDCGVIHDYLAKDFKESLKTVRRK